MRRFTVMASAALLLAATVHLQAQPVPIWSSSLDDVASSTINGGNIVAPPATFVPGFKGNAFAGNGSVYVAWDNTRVANVFDGVWNNSLGSTVDLFFSGDHWDSHTGDSGFWSVVDRGDGSDGHLIVSVRDGKLRFPYRDSYSSAVVAHHLAAVPLANNTVYRLTVRQFNGTLEVYLDGGAYTNNAPVYTGSHPGTCSFPAPNTGSGTTGREMNIANRSRFFGGILKSGEWVDNVRVFNGYYTPAEIPLPVEGLPVAVATPDKFSGFVPLTVQFDGSASYDTDGGTITGYAWDFDNNGVDDNTSGPIVSHQYTTAGTHVCKLTVTDNDGKTAFVLVPIQVNSAPATGLLTITAMEPSGALPAGTNLLTSVTTQRSGSTESFTAFDLVGPPDASYVEVIGAMTGGGAGAATPADAMVGLELGSTVSGLNLDGEFLAGYFADHVLVKADGTAAPEVFFIESSNTSDNFQIQLLTNAPGAAIAIAATIQVRLIDYASTATSVGGTGRGGVGIDLDALGVGAIRGIRITGADGFGGESGVDPAVIAAIFEPCNTPFADQDGDLDVDMNDFAAFQKCLTRSGDPNGVFDFVNCYCLDRDRDQDIDEYDLNQFMHCATGPAILWSQELAPNCTP